jgi:hypothetical protein
VFHRVLHMFQGGNVDILSGSLTNNGMVQAIVFDILTRSALAHCSQRTGALR